MHSTGLLLELSAHGPISAVSKEKWHPACSFLKPQNSEEIAPHFLGSVTGKKNQSTPLKVLYLQYEFKDDKILIWLLLIL